MTLAIANHIQLKKFNFEHAIRPVYYFSRFTGQWPFSISHNSMGKIERAHIGFLEILWPILVICLNFTVTLDSYEQFKAEQENHPIRIRFIVENILDMCSVLSIVLGIINRNIVVDILKKFSTFDNEVNHIFPVHNSNKISLSNFASIKTGIEIWRSFQLQV